MYGLFNKIKKTIKGFSTLETFLENFLKNLLGALPWFFIGLFATLFLALPYFVLKQGCYIQINDQLDGEVLNYIYRAKYFFNGNIVPEFMNGANKISMTPPAFLGVLFYRFLPPFAAFACMHIFVLVIGYIGMYMLAFLLTQKRRIAFLTAVLFVYLPFYPVYGLSILGQPLLIYSILTLCGLGNLDKRKTYVLYYIPVLLYGFGSSFALVGFAVLIILAVIIAIFIIYAIKNSVIKYKFDKYKIYKYNELSIKNNISKLKTLVFVFLTLLLVYILCNFNLVTNAFYNGFTVHRDEMVIAPLPFLKNFGEILFEGGVYAKSYNYIIFILTICVILFYIISLILRKNSKENNDNIYREIISLFALVICIAFLAAFWRCSGIVKLRMELGGALKSFQFDRICWLLPVLWYCLLALDLKVVITYLLKLKKLHLFSGFLILSLLVFVLCLRIYNESTIYHNLRLMIFPNTYHLMNWKDFYAEDIYSEIDKCIDSDKATYKVVSVGISPASALYNGFYCLDGYSNYYPLEYKHNFRKIIEKELEKNDELRVYFDLWGNRVYMFNAETGNYMMISKNVDSSYQHLEYNIEQLYNMGCRYIFSAMPIDNAKELKLKLLEQSPFCSQDSYYAIWVYLIDY